MGFLKITRLGPSLVPVPPKTNSRSLSPGPLSGTELTDDSFSRKLSSAFLLLSGNHQRSSNQHKLLTKGNIRVGTYYAGARLWLEGDTEEDYSASLSQGSTQSRTGREKAASIAPTTELSSDTSIGYASIISRFSDRAVWNTRATNPDIVSQRKVAIIQFELSTAITYLEHTSNTTHSTQ